MSERDDDDFEIDIEALDRRYAEERDKRLRGDATAQFAPLRQRFAAFATDPHADPMFERSTVAEDAEVVIIGGGFAGLLVAARLRQQGVRDIRILEKGAGFGGTWYWNRYPGAACDVESYIYLPMLEELGDLPSQRYIGSAEIRRHCERLAAHFDLHSAALFQTQAKFLGWDDGARRWLVATDRGDRLHARYVVSCTGLLSNPKLPAIAGLESFEGHAFHTSRWDYAYTGGSEEGEPLSGLADKRVGIIGTGSTGVQVIPQLAAAAGHLFVFQRTPSSIDVRNNRPTDPGLIGSFAPGWQRARRNNFTHLVGGGFSDVDLVQDSWTDIIRNLAPRQIDGTPVADPAAIREAEMRKMERVRRRIDQHVRDPATAEALKPYFHYFCKRPCFHDDYLTAFNRASVTLVDTRGKGVERITPAGVVAGGTEYPLDCLIFATGFDFLTRYWVEADMEIVGEGGKPLSEHWQDGPRTLYGIQTRGFPNLFLVSIAQAGAAVNYVHTADEQALTIARLIAESGRRGAGTVQPTQDAQDAWVQQIVDGAQARRAFLETCTPGYYNYEGKRERYADLNDFYPGGPMAYIDLLAEWRSRPGLPGFELGEALPA